MKPKLDLLIKASTLRFSVWNGSPIYHFTREADVQLDGMENMMGVDPEEQAIFDTNLGFLPSSNTVLIRGEKNIVVDPGNFHTGNYGMVESALEERDLAPADIDVVVATHSHHDHMASTFLFPDSKLIVGKGELEFARENSWPEFVNALTVDRVEEVEYVDPDEEVREISDNVFALYTPGHTPGSVSVFVETESDQVAVVGDSALTKSEYKDRELSHWYPSEQKEQINESLDKINSYDPSLIIPGHDSPFAHGN